MDNELNIFLKFIGGLGTILVRDEKDFRRFVEMLNRHNVVDILGNKKYQNYDEWKYLAIINNKNRDVMCFEYQPGKGLSWYDNTKDPSEWYGEAPMVLKGHDPYDRLAESLFA